MKERTAARLSLLYFLQFAAWGCYLTCFGQLLGSHGLGGEISWFYAAAGLVSLVTPPLAGYMADRFIPAKYLLAICHGFGAVCMLLCWSYASTHEEMLFLPFFVLYLSFLSFYMATPALANTLSFGVLRTAGLEPVNVFPQIRVWGTLGFVAAMWFVNSAYIFDGAFGFTFSDSDITSMFRFQYTPMQLFSCSVIEALTVMYVLTLPDGRTGIRHHQNGIFDVFGLRGLLLFRDRRVGAFLLFAMFAGVCLQISNGFATPYLNHFMGLPEYFSSAMAGNATLLMSLSQLSEALCILFVGVAMKRIGIRSTLFIAMIAWSLRFLFLGLGNPGDGLMVLALSMIVYGVAFDFFTIAGQIYMDQISVKGVKGLGQGTLMMVSNGIGATCGMIVAGQVINHFCEWKQAGNGMTLCMGDWNSCWMIFAGYSFVVGVLFVLISRNRKTGKAR